VIDIEEVLDVIFEEVNLLTAVIASGGAESAVVEPDQIRQVQVDWPCPSRDHLRTVIESAFWATTLVEEGRRTRFRIGVNGEVDPSNDVVQRGFTKAIPLTAESIRRLAPSLNPNVGLMDVRSDADGTFIRGVINHRRYSGKFPFSIHGTSPGDLQFSWALHRIVQLVNGRIDRLSTVAMPNQSLLRHYVNGVGPLADSSIDFPRDLSRAVERVQEMGHGGSIWIPSSAAELNGVRIKYEFTTSNDGGPGEYSPFTSISWGDAIGQYSGVDGAVIVASDATVRGFGAFIDLCPIDSVTVIGLSQSSSQVSGSDIGGGRHQSAAAFCLQHPGSLAIVVSQDGATSTIWSDKASQISMVRWSPLGADF